MREATTNAPHSPPKRTPVGPKHQGLSASSFVAFRCRFFICLMGDKGSCEGKASRFEMFSAGGKKGGNRKYVSRFTSWNGIQFLFYLFVDLLQESLQHLATQIPPVHKEAVVGGWCGHFWLDVLRTVFRRA